jgi:hypothetical protein
MLAQLPRGFCDAGLTGVLSLQIIRLLADLQTVRAKVMSTSQELEFDVASRRKLQVMLEDLHRLATLTTTTTERYLSQGLVAYSFLFRGIHFRDPLTGFYQTSLMALADFSKNQVPSQIPEDRRCYIWSNMMIGTILEEAQVRPDGWTDVLDQFLDQYDESRWWQRLEKELKLFFFEDNIRAKVKNAYDEAIQRKKTQSPSDKDAGLAKMAIRHVVL